MMGTLGDPQPGGAGQITASGPPKLLIEGLRIDLGEVEIVHGIDLEVPPGSMVGLVGPNGSGKTTVLRSCYRALRPRTGVVWMDRQDIWKLTARESAQSIAVVAQDGPGEFDFTAAEVAALGRLPHKRGFDRDDEHDRELVLTSLDALGLVHLAHRPFSQMSGGERQRTLIARALVQESRVLILDEPTNHLDIRYQLDVLHHVRSLGMTVIAALHDLNLAAAWCDRVYVIQDGVIVSGGSAEQALRPEVIDQVFGVTTHLVSHPATGRPHFIFDRSS
jgi:iron complex transport system ATP-binding protein